MEEGKKMSRRKFLGVSSTAAAGVAIGAAIVGGVTGYYAGSISAQPQVIEKPIEKPVEVPVEKKVKALWVYVGPVGDFGYSYAHDRGRQIASNKLKWINSTYMENVPEAQFSGAVETALEEGINVVFGTTWGYADTMKKLAEENPEVMFVHASSGFWSGAAGTAPENMSAAWIHPYPGYYLAGLAAGGVTKTGKVGYVAAHPIPSVLGELNAFFLGFSQVAKARGLDPKLHLVWLFDWFNPGKTREAAISLIDNFNIDIIGHSEDSAVTLQVAEEYWDKGRKIWAHCRSSDMSQYGPRSQLTGPIVNWAPVYEEFLTMYYAGIMESKHIRAKIGDYMNYRWRKPVEESTAGMDDGSALQIAPVNAAVPDDVKVLIKQRYEEMKEWLFEPFTGPIRNNQGKLVLKEGERMDNQGIENLSFLIEGVEGELPA